MSISNSQLASDLGWDNGWEIPVANEENKTLSSQLAAKTREKDLYSGKSQFFMDRPSSFLDQMKVAGHISLARPFSTTLVLRVGFQG